MLFDTFEFAVLFIFVYCLYLVLRHRWQNVLLLLASYFFYGWWDWRFLILLWFATGLDFFIGIKLAATESPRKRKWLLAASITAHLCILAFFKYCNFFIDTAAPILSSLLAVTPRDLHLNLVLPAGLSIYTLQSMSYTIAIYRGQMKPTRNLLNFAAFLAYFPQLLAGPIERATRLLPAMESPRTITALGIFEGMHLIAWGLLKKVVIANNLAKVVETVFKPNADVGCWSVIIGTVAFAFQVYGDFSGYADIGRGCSKMMGIDLMLNFNLPYFASSVRDFWRRWNISLSTWLRDYLYVPLGGDRHSKLITYRNLFLTFILGGLWYGAGWTFVLWGVYHGALLAIHRVFFPLGRDRAWHDSSGARRKALWVGEVLLTFILICFGWILFRAQRMDVLSNVVASLFKPESISVFSTTGLSVLLFILPLLFVQFFQYFKRDLDWLLQVHWAWRGVAYASIIYGIIIWGAGAGKTFVFYQF